MSYGYGFGPALQSWWQKNVMGQGAEPAKPTGSKVSSGVKPKPSAGGSSNPLVDAMLGLLGGGGSAGSYTPGYNGAPARAAANTAYERQLGNTKNVYGQIDTQIAGRAPQIAAGYQQASAAINDDANKRAAADAARGAEADQRNLATAAALGLTAVQPTGTQADALQQAGTNAYQSNAQAWNGFNQAAQQTALERNTATGDAFRYAGTQAETSLGAMLQQALAAIAGQEASHRGGYSGGKAGGGNDFKILSQLMDYDLAQQKLGAAGGGLTSISPAGWSAIQAAYGALPGGGSGVTSSQANAAALQGLASNPRDFATLFAALNGK
jgi:hypothetical protein